jgi:hypothetical protein
VNMLPQPQRSCLPTSSLNDHTQDAFGQVDELVGQESLQVRNQEKKWLLYCASEAKPRNASWCWWSEPQPRAHACHDQKSPQSSTYYNKHNAQLPRLLWHNHTLNYLISSQVASATSNMPLGLNNPLPSSMSSKYFCRNACTRRPVTSTDS